MIICIGAPYEADHQLASLYKQGVVDYVVTIDSDLICLGVDVIIDMNLATSRCWPMTLDKLLSERLPKEFKTQGVTWTQDLLSQVACLILFRQLSKSHQSAPLSQYVHLCFKISSLTSNSTFALIPLWVILTLTCF